jgi:hypothetical protein
MPVVGAGDRIVRCDPAGGNADKNDRPRREENGGRRSPQDTPRERPRGHHEDARVRSRTKPGTGTIGFFGTSGRGHENRSIPADPSGKPPKAG